MRQALDQRVELRLDSALTLLRAAREADETFLPVHFWYLRWMAERGAIEQLRSEYQGALGGPHARCLATFVRGSQGFNGAVVPALLAIERESGRGACTSLFIALFAGDNLPRRPAFELVARSGAVAVSQHPQLIQVSDSYASALCFLGRHAEEMRTLRRALEIAPHAYERLRAQGSLMHAHVRHNDTIAGRRAYEAARVAVARDGRRGLTLELLEMGQGIPRADAHAHETAAKLAQRWGAWPIEYRLNFVIGVALFDHGGDATGAMRWLDRAVRIADSVDADFLRSPAYVKRGRTMARMGRLADSERDLRRAIDAATRLRDDYWLAEAWHNLAHVYEGVGRMADASRAADRFIGATKSVSGAPIRVMSFRDAGLMRWNAGWHAAANEAFDQMVRAIDEQGAQHYWAGEHFERTGQLDRALARYRLAQREGNDPTLALAARARIFELIGQIDSAEALAKAHDALAGTHPDDVPRLPAYLARKGRVDEAARMLRGWADQRLAQRNVHGAVKTLLQLAEMMLEFGDPADAVIVAARADSLARPLHLVEASMHARRLRGRALLRLNRSEEAIATLQTTAGFARQQSVPDAVFASHVALGDAYAAVNQRGAALKAYDVATRASELVADRLSTDSDRAAYRARQLAPYNSALQVLLRGPENGATVDALLAWSERRKAAALHIGTGIRDQPGTVSARALQAKLRPGEALVDYVVVNSQVAAVVVTDEQARLYRLARTAADVRHLAGTLRAPFARTYNGRLDVSRAHFNAAAAHALYKDLIEPLLAQIGARTRLLIVPDGALHYVPFDALVEHIATRTGSGSRADPDYHRSRYLIDRFETVILPSVHFLARRGARGASLASWRGARVLAAARDVPGGSEELAAIRAAWPASAVTTLEGARTTESAQLADTTYQILHLATHATIDDRDPLASFLRLSPDDRNDGLLHLAEISRWSTAPRLAVLSACETLTGPLLDGEGFIGLARAFLVAGADAVIASYWPVGSASAHVAGVLHRELAAGRSVGTALRTAKLDVRGRASTAHPFYWAGVVLTSTEGSQAIERRRKAR